MAIFVSNLQIEQGTDFEHLFALGDNDNNTTLNLAGFTASAQLRKWAGSTGTKAARRAPFRFSREISRGHRSRGVPHLG